MSQIPPPLPPGVLNYEKFVVARQSFGLHRWGWICWLVAAAAVAVLTAFERPFEPERLPFYIGGIVLGVLLVGLVPALIVFFAAQRSRTAATITFVAVIALGTFGTATKALRTIRARNAQQAWVQYSTQMKQAQTAIREQLRNPAMADDKTQQEIVNRLTGSSQKLAAALDGDEALVIRAATRWMQGVGQRRTAYDQAVAAVHEKTPLNPAWIKTKADLAVARDRIAKLRQTSAQLRSVYGNIKVDMDRELIREGVSPTRRAQALAGGLTALTKGQPYQSAIRDLDDRFATELTKACDLLEETWGAWHVEPGDPSRLIFADPKASDRFNAIVDGINDIGTQQAEKQRQFADVMYPAPGTPATLPAP